MNLEVYCEYARKYKINCCLSELMVECNKHYIINIIESEIPNSKCVLFEIDDNYIKITMVNRRSLKKEAFVIVEINYLYDPNLFNCSPQNNNFAYLIFNSY